MPVGACSGTMARAPVATGIQLLGQAQPAGRGSAAPGRGSRAAAGPPGSGAGTARRARSRVRWDLWCRRLFRGQRLQQRHRLRPFAERVVRHARRAARSVAWRCAQDLARLDAFQLRGRDLRRNACDEGGLRRWRWLADAHRVPSQRGARCAYDHGHRVQAHVRDATCRNGRAPPCICARPCSPTATCHRCRRRTHTLAARFASTPDPPMATSCRHPPACRPAALGGIDERCPGFARRGTASTGCLPVDPAAANAAAVRAQRPMPGRCAPARRRPCPTGGLFHRRRADPPAHHRRQQTLAWRIFTSTASRARAAPS
jgi:hypothetical protein